MLVYRRKKNIQQTSNFSKTDIYEICYMTAKFGNRIYQQDKLLSERGDNC